MSTALLAYYSYSAYNELLDQPHTCIGDCLLFQTMDEYLLFQTMGEHFSRKWARGLEYERVFFQNID